MKEVLCGICGFATDKESRVHSKYTGAYYCLDLDECHRRAEGKDLTYQEIVEGCKRMTAKINNMR